jgi:hypothetical protein
VYVDTDETELGERALRLLTDFTLVMDNMLGHCIGIDLDEGIVSLSPDLTACEFLGYILIAIGRILAGCTLSDRDILDLLPELDMPWDGHRLRVAIAC